MREPEKVIIYRSKGEQIRDEMLWSEGYFTPTVLGDIFVILIGLFLLAIAWAKGSDMLRSWRWRRQRGGRR